MTSNPVKTDASFSFTQKIVGSFNMSGLKLVGAGEAFKMEICKDEMQCAHKKTNAVVMMDLKIKLRYFLTQERAISLK